MLYLITGNKGKFSEFKTILKGVSVRQLDVELPEIQELDSRSIIRAKLAEGLKHKSGDIAVEDSSLYLRCMNGMPGPLVKWFMKAIGSEGIYHIAEGFGDYSAEVRCTIGYATSKGAMHFFEGSVLGKVVSPKGSNGFGWDVIFVPEGFSKTFGEMSAEEKNRISHRKLAADKLSAFLEKAGKIK
jgi:non-canonical purine NTP pyrophosphatase (RdgB/HAM1 family)